MECLIACIEYPKCPCGKCDCDFDDDFIDEEFLNPDEFDDWFTEEE